MDGNGSPNQEIFSLMKDLMLEEKQIKASFRCCWKPVGFKCFNVDEGTVVVKEH